MTSNATEWDYDDWSKYRHEILERQSMLVELKVVPLICRIVSYSKRVSVVEEAILVAIAVLLGGNEESQEEFNNYIVEVDTYNDFLLRIFELLKEYFEIIKSN